MELSGPERKSSLVSPNVSEGSEAGRMESETGILFRHNDSGGQGNTDCRKKEPMEEL